MQTELPCNLFDLSEAINKCKKSQSKKLTGFIFGADYRIRTDDLPLTRRLLYQLS
jgi:hypothetical protein